MAGPSALVHGASLTRRIAYNTAMQAAGRLLGAVLAVAVLRLSTRYLGTGRYGAVVAATALVTLLATLADWGLGTVAGREMAREPERAGSIFGAALGMRIVMSTVLVPVAIGLGAAMYHGHQTVLLSVVVLSPLLVLTAAQSAAGAVLIARQRTDLAAVADVVSRLVLLAAVVTVTQLDLGLVPYLWTAVVGNGVAAVVTLGVAARYLPLRPVFSLGSWRALFLLAAPLGAVQIANVFYFRIDSVLLSLMRPAADVGRYGVAYKVIELLMAMPSFFMLALLPSLAVASPHRAAHIVQRAFDVLAPAGVLVAVAGVLLAPGIVTAVSSSSYLGASTAFAILAVGVGTSFVAAVGGNTLVAMGMQKRLLGLTAAVVLGNLVLNLAAIPRFGIEGSAGATTATEIFAMVYVTMLLRRSTGIHIRLGQAARALVAGAAMAVTGAVLRMHGMTSEGPGAFLTISAASCGSFVLVFAVTGGLASLRKSPRDADP